MHGDKILRNKKPPSTKAKMSSVAEHAAEIIWKNIQPIIYPLIAILKDKNRIMQFRFQERPSFGVGGCIV